MKLNELIEKGLLIRSSSTEKEIEGSIAIAEKFLSKAVGNKKIEYYDVAFSLAYQSMFHSARALLFKSNLKERSHSAMIAALKEIYGIKAELMKFLNALNSYRVTRHAIQYTGIGCSKEDADQAIRDAKGFIEVVDKIIFEKSG